MVHKQLQQREREIFEKRVDITCTRTYTDVMYIQYSFFAMFTNGQHSIHLQCYMYMYVNQSKANGGTEGRQLYTCSFEEKAELP